MVMAMPVVESEGYILPWKFRVNAKVKPIGHIWGLELSRYVCFSFPGKTILVDI